MDDIGAAAGVTGPAIYRHFDSKAAVLAAVFDRIIDAVDTGDTVDPGDPSDTGSVDQPATVGLQTLIARYARGVADRRRLMAVFVREVHHLPPEHAVRLRERQRALVRRWRDLVARIHPEWSPERVRTAVHAVFGLLNSVGTFDSVLSDAELADQLADLASATFQLSR
jgi:AcrR family transcriptional regulator